MSSTPENHDPPDARRTAGSGNIEIPLEYRRLWDIARALIGTEPGVAFLDSGGSSPQAGWSFLGWRPRRVVAWPQGRQGAFERLRDCLDANHTFRIEAGGVPFRGGWMGWFSYDLGRHVERLPSLARRDESIPDFVIGEYDMVLAEDHTNRALWAAARPGSPDDEKRVRRRAEQALQMADGRSGEAIADTPSTTVAAERARRAAAGAAALDLPRGLMERGTYRRCIESILGHINDGSIYQANLSHRFASRTTAPSRRIYELLRRESPAPFACYLGLPGGPEILSASPELFLRKTGERLQTRPIKGTRPRHADNAIDVRLREELRTSEKERAELLMITDLLRNDLGRVAEYGSVQVDTLRALESHPTVHHAHSEISARMRGDLGIADLLAATIPGGSVTGAPKIRAMEILDELEPERRGPYTGAAGYIGDDGNLCLNILIRTLVRRGDEVWYQVGGGIVAESDPEAEYEETLAKGAALQRALRRVGAR